MNNNPFEQGNDEGSVFEKNPSKSTVNQNTSFENDKNNISNIEQIYKEKKNSNNILSKVIVIIIVVLIIIIVIIGEILMNHKNGPEINFSTENGQEIYTVENIRQQYPEDSDYWTLEVGEDIPEGLYSTNKLRLVNIQIDFTEEQKKYLEDRNLDSILTFSLNNEQIENLPLYDGMEVELSLQESFAEEYILALTEKVGLDEALFEKAQTLELKKTSELEDIELKELDLENANKVGLYQTNDSKITIPTESFQKIKVYSTSSDGSEVKKYKCISGNCEDGSGDETLSTLELLDKTYILIN